MNVKRDIEKCQSCLNDGIKWSNKYMSEIIKQFQKEHALTPDGLIGKQTLTKIKELLNIYNDESLAHFMGQCDHESNGFTAVVENLNYSANALLKIFKKYFPSLDIAKKYERKPQSIANRVYANRMGNGDENSGDGWIHRGFGFIQLTGKNNQQAFAKYIKNDDIIENPSLIATKYPFESAKYYFDNNKIWLYTKTVDEKSILKVSKIINIGNVNSKLTPIGFDDRLGKTIKYYNMLKK